MSRHFPSNGHFEELIFLSQELIFTHIFSEHKEIEGMVANLILDFQVAAAPW